MKSIEIKKPCNHVRLFLSTNKQLVKIEYIFANKTA